MKLEITRNSIRIVPEDKYRVDRDERDTAFIEEVLGLKNDGDVVSLRRINANNLPCIAYLEARKEER